MAPEASTGPLPAESLFLLKKKLFTKFSDIPNFTNFFKKLANNSLRTYMYLMRIAITTSRRRPSLVLIVKTKG